MNAPTPQHPFKSQSFVHSLGFALHGLRAVVSTERNFRTHIIMAVLVIAGGWYFQVRLVEWAVLILCMSLMMVIEALNTAIEYLVDMLAENRYNEKAKMVKDIAAGACLISAVGVAMAGFLIFWPYLLIIFKKFIYS
jgi:diacylglycerol kinase